jgi:Fe-S-cluster containining protein
MFTEKLDDRYAAMKGTDSVSPRCTCLVGDVGKSARCSIYLKRPSPCREFLIHGEAGENQRCNQARIRHGLSAIDLKIEVAS